MLIFSSSEFKKRSLSIKASNAEMAKLLGFDGKHAADKVRAIESGRAAATLPVQRLAEYMQQGFRLGDINGDTSEPMPNYLRCADLEGERDPEWVFYTRYPRFIGRVTSQEPVAGTHCARVDDSRWLIVTLWVDAPLLTSYHFEKVEQAAALYAKHAEKAHTS